MKRATLMKRMLRKPREAPRERIDTQIVEAAHELQKTTQKLEGTRSESRRELVHLESLRVERETAEQKTKEAVTAAYARLERALSKLKAAESQKGTLSRDLSILKKEVKDASSAHKKAQKDLDAALKAKKKRAIEEGKYTEAKAKTRAETKKLAKLYVQFVETKKDLETMEKEMEGKSAAHKNRSKNFEVARKRLANYGKRLKALYEKKGLALPEEIIKLPELL